MMVCSVVTGEQIKLFRKTPEEVMDYGFSYEKTLEPGESLDSSTFVLVPGTGGSVVKNTDAVDATKAAILLSAGAVGDPRAEFLNVVTTTGGAWSRTYARRFALDIVEKKGR